MASQAAGYRADLTNAFRAALNRALEMGEIRGPIDGQAEILVLSAMGLFTVMSAGASAGEINGLIAGLEQLLDSWATSA